MAGYTDPSEKTMGWAAVKQFLVERIHGPVALLARSIPACKLSPAVFDQWNTTSQTPGPPESVKDLLQRVQPLPHSKGVSGISVDAEWTLVWASLEHHTVQPLQAVCLVPGNLKIATQLVANALEAWLLSCEVADARLSLEESAMQLAQSFEEQSWLRGFAQNAACISRISSAKQMADSILKPLGYLLRAEDVFLLMHPEESERSGIMSAKYGSSSFTVTTIREYLRVENFNDQSPPLVRNQLDHATRNGQLHSIVAVALNVAGNGLGFLVAINRSADHHQGLPVYDPEFGSGDVGILEEAAVLLTTQVQNLHLLIQSHQMFLGTLHAMSSAIDARDPYTQGHSERVARLSFELAQSMGLENTACQEIYLAGILHDIGKIGIPDAVLLKQASLTDEEFAIIKKHPEIGYRIVEALGSLQFALPGVLYHHERWDGRGYPHQLAGEAIPLMARIMAVADAFDAMTSTRPYRQAMSLEKARGIIREGAAKQWDAQVVHHFELWISQHVQKSSPPSTASIIPQGSLMENMVQAVATLVH